MSSVIIVLIVFSFTAFIVKMGLDHEREKRTLPRASDNSMTASELRRMIQEAVEDANHDMKQRLDTLERRLDRVPDRPSIPERFEDPPESRSGDRSSG